MGNPVAKVGEVMAKGGTSMYSPATSGSWVATPVVPTPHGNITIGGVNALKKAECVFLFFGVDPNGVTVAGSEKVVLEPQSTRLTGGGVGVLVSGDKQTGNYGNELSVSSSNPLTTD